MIDTQERPPGILGSLRGILDGGLAMLQTRIELFAVELRQEKCRWIETIVWTSVAIALGVMALMLLTAIAVILFWDTSRVAVLLTLSVLYVAGAIVTGVKARARLRRNPGFTGTLGQLKKDRECFGTEN